MKKVLRILSYVMVASIASAATAAVMLQTSWRAAGTSSAGKLGQVSALIQEKFIGEVDVKAMEDAAANAMIASLGDRWSYYLNAEAYKSYLDQMNNSYVGVGITITVREDGYLDILEVVENGPAQKAGILPGDILIQADGQDCAELGIDASKNIIRGEENTNVALTVLRDGQQLTMEVTRASFQIPVAQYQMLDGRIGYITIENFDNRCADETIAAIDALVEQGAVALIFDVRNNPGGYVSELCEVLDYILPEGPLFHSEYYDGTTTRETSDANCLELPMAVLVNGESYSAAEFFGAALQEYEVAVIVGEKTCGKGYFQRTYPLGDGSAVGLSVGKYSTPHGVNLAGVGITPDVLVEVDEELFLQIYYGNVEPMDDPQVLAAIEALKVGK